jgi:hypothetical protein
VGDIWRPNCVFHFSFFIKLLILHSNSSTDVTQFHHFLMILFEHATIKGKSMTWFKLLVLLYCCLGDWCSTNTWALHRYTLPMMINFFLFLCFQIVFNSSSLFMSMSNFIWIGKINTWKGTCYFSFSYSCWWVGKKSELVIGIRGSF